MRNRAVIQLAALLSLAVWLGCAPASAALIGFWNFDETSGTVAHDSSGSGIDGTLSSSNAAFDPGAGIGGGGAANLSSGGYVSMGNNYAFGGTQAFTIQAWINTTDPNGASVVARHYTSNQDGYMVGINNIDPGCIASNAGQAVIFTGNGGGGCVQLALGTTQVTNGAWHQLVDVVGGGTESLYVDGALQASTTGVSIASCPTVDFLIGGADSGVGGGEGGTGCGIGPAAGSYAGLVSDVAVWNTALTAGQVSALDAHPNDPFVLAAPEPATLSVLGMGLLGLAGVRRRRTQRGDRGSIRPGSADRHRNASRSQSNLQGRD